MDVSPLNLGMVASYYYIQYTTVEQFAAGVSEKAKLKNLIEILSAATEYNLITLRQNEDSQIERLSKHLPQALPNEVKFDEISTKVNVLLQCYFSRFPLPVDLMLDLNMGVLKHACKLVQAIVDVLSTEGWLKPALCAMELSQMLVQGMWAKDPVLYQLPHFTTDILQRLADFSSERNVAPIVTVFDLLEMEDADREECLQMTPAQLSDVAAFCNNYPNIELNFAVNGGSLRGNNVDEEGDVVEVFV